MEASRYMNMTLFLIILLMSILLAAGILFFQWPVIQQRRCKRQVDAATKYFFGSSSYYLMKDVVLLTFEGLIQIDFIIVSRFGVFVVAIYDYKGVIEGTELSDTWFQIVNKKEKHEFINPSLQNKKNAETLRSLIDIDRKHIFPVVVFDNISGFKSNMMTRT